MKLGNFIPVGIDGKSSHVISLITARRGDEDYYLPTTGVGLFLSQYADGETREYGSALNDEDVEKAIPIGGIWYFDEKAIDAAIEMLEACKEFFKKESGEEQT